MHFRHLYLLGNLWTATQCISATFIYWALVNRPMDCIFRPQLEFILKRGTGIKACLFDLESKQIVSNLIPCSQFQDNNFFYFDYITNRNRTAVEGMVCVVIVRPSSLKSIIEELACPFYGSYIILFTSQIDPFALDILANADIKSLVSEVHEINLDLYKQAPYLYTTNSEKYKRVLDGLVSCLLSLEIHPGIKVFDENATADLSHPVAGTSLDDVQGQDGDRTLVHLARDLDAKCKQFSFKKRGTVVLLKRNFDLITPLMYDWHYQSMIYEHLAADNSLVTVNQKEYPLSDAFFCRNRFLEIATVGENIKAMVGEIDRAQARMAGRDFEEIEESMALKATAEVHLCIYNSLISECISNKALSEYENEVLCDKGRVDIKGVISQLSDAQALKLILIYFLRWVRDWEDASKEFPKFRPQILRFYRSYRPKNFAYKNAFDTGLDVKLGYISPLKRMVRHLIQRRVREGALADITAGSRDVSPIVIYIEGGITMKEYREVLQCGEELKVEVIFIGSEITNSQKLLRRIL